jgi:hypothetical protein
MNFEFLYIEYEKDSYIGCLLFDNPPFCLQIAKLLQDWCGHPICEIGGLDLSFTLSDSVVPALFCKRLFNRRS